MKHPEACVYCHYCEIICPDLAIFSMELPAEPSRGEGAAGDCSAAS
ncbi:MAG: 4Fe-4S binding protein [Desulfosoma sp.]